MDGDKALKGERYAAWIVPSAGQGDVRVIDLGEAAAIDAAVAAVRQGLLAAQGGSKQKSVIVEKGEAEAEKELQTALASLGRLVLTPLLGHIDGKEQWVISPDGPLWLVPWAALPLKDGRYAIEGHTIRHVVSGRDLVAAQSKAPAKRDGSVIFADPDFDLTADAARKRSQELLGTGLRSVLVRSTVSGSRLPTVARLPGTAAEAQAIKPKLIQYLGQEPYVYRRTAALESMVKSFHGPRVMVLSTHGFFLAAPEAKSATDRRPVDNPLLRCGLLMAGCNSREQLQDRDEDGVLTGLEIVGIDLRGTELVVLSACETGLGQVNNGEGVAGLRQAFQLAGAHSVVASLWQVSDKETAQLMTDFFDGLAKGKTKAEALREAQLARIKAHRDRDGAAHPFFWAAFTLTGR